MNRKRGEHIQNVQKAVEAEHSQDQDLNQWLKVMEDHVLACLLKQKIATLKAVPVSQ